MLSNQVLSYATQIPTLYFESKTRRDTENLHKGVGAMKGKCKEQESTGTITLVYVHQETSSQQCSLQVP